MKRTIEVIVLVAAVLIMPACSVGLIYTHTYRPLTLDMNHTEIIPSSQIGDIKHIQFSWVGVAWDSDAIGDIAKKHGVNTIYFADLETLSVLTIWNQYTVHVYGK